MITVLYPSSTNWFYARFAHALVEDLRRLGIVVQATSSSTISAQDRNSTTVLLVNYAEIVFDCTRRGTERILRREIMQFDRRILVNMDSLQTGWFEKQMVEGTGLFTDVVDYGMISQCHDDKILGVPLRWIREALCDKIKQSLPKQRGARPIPWAIIGHETSGRAAFAAAATQTLCKEGFVYIPSLKPFDGTYGLDHVALAKVLSSSEFYLWGSHHHHRYHECFRACDAIACGAVPVKIDPLYSGRMDLPWIYPSLQAFKHSDAYKSPDKAYRSAASRLGENGTLGDNFASALGDAGVVLEIRAPSYA